MSLFENSSQLAIIVWVDEWNGCGCYVLTHRCNRAIFRQKSSLPPAEQSRNIAIEKMGTLKISSIGK